MIRNSHFVTSIHLILLLSLVTMQCASYSIYNRPDFRVASAGKIFVYQFENLTSHAHAGEIVTANFITELRSFIPNEILDALFIVNKDTEITTKNGFTIDLNLTSVNDKIKLAKKFSAALIIIGKVTEFKYKKGLGEEPVVGLNVQMIRVDSREVVWQASISVAKHVFGWGEQSLNEYSQRAVQKVIETLK